MPCKTKKLVGITIVKITCAYCGKEHDKYIGDVNQANKKGLPLFCDRTCAGLNRRKTIEEKKKVKADYDKKIYDTPERKALRKKYFQKSYTNNPEKYRAIRKAKYPKHLEYLNTPEYKKWKQGYDQKYRSKKLYAGFAECALILKELENIIFQNAPEGMHFQMGITNKTQKRKRLWQKTIKQKN